MDSYKIFRQLEEREKRKNPYKFYDKDELIDTIIELEDNIEVLQSKIDKAIYWINEYCIKECEEGDIKAELRNVKDILKGDGK